MRAEEGNTELVESIKQERWRDVPDVTAREHALCAVAEKMRATRTDMMEGDWQPLRDVGFGDTECLKVRHIVGLFNYLTRLADGFRLKLDVKTEEARSIGKALLRPS